MTEVVGVDAAVDVLRATDEGAEEAPAVTLEGRVNGVREAVVVGRTGTADFTGFPVSGRTDHQAVSEPASR